MKITLTAEVSEKLLSMIEGLTGKTLQQVAEQSVTHAMSDPKIRAMMAAQHAYYMATIPPGEQEDAAVIDAMFRDVMDESAKS